jgi:site-specific DNA-cytosine methylase
MVSIKAHWVANINMCPSPRKIHRQIGNAVPWPLAQAIGRELRKADYAEWEKNRILIDVVD